MEFLLLFHFVLLLSCYVENDLNENEGKLNDEQIHILNTKLCCCVL